MNLDQYEQSIIREALRRAAGNKSQAARLLGITTKCVALPVVADGHRRRCGFGQLDDGVLYASIQERLHIRDGRIQQALTALLWSPRRCAASRYSS